MREPGSIRAMLTPNQASLNQADTTTFLPLEFKEKGTETGMFRTRSH
jgi:hypothetical protein